jgi:hypothetical protein
LTVAALWVAGVFCWGVTGHNFEGYVWAQSSVTYARDCGAGDDFSGTQEQTVCAAAEWTNASPNERFMHGRPVWQTFKLAVLPALLLLLFAGFACEILAGALSIVGRYVKWVRGPAA